jgi:hypothetical protein
VLVQLGTIISKKKRVQGAIIGGVAGPESVLVPNIDGSKKIVKNFFFG